MTRWNPRFYDTVYFAFTYEDTKDILTVRIKNESVQSKTEDPPYLVFHRGTGDFPVSVEIHDIFAEGRTLPVHTHVHRLGQFFTPWFKAHHDARVELERGLHRFYALHAYDLLDKSPSAFEHALDNTANFLNQTVENLPTLIEKHAALKTKLAFNYQDKGVHTKRGTSIFDTREKVWIMFETGTQHPEKPEYLWDVIVMDPLTMCPDELPLTMYPLPNEQAFTLIMSEQKERYGCNAVDLDIIENSAHRVQAVITQLELILDKPPQTTVQDQLESILGNERL